MLYDLSVYIHIISYSLLHLFLCVNYFYKIASYPFIKITVRVRAKTWNMFVSLSVTHSTNLFLAMQWGKSLSPSESRARGVAFEKNFYRVGNCCKTTSGGKDGNFIHLTKAEPSHPHLETKCCTSNKLKGELLDSKSCVECLFEKFNLKKFWQNAKI